MNTKGKTRFTFRTAAAVAVATASMVAPGSMTAASAAHKAEGPGSSHAAQRPTPEASTVTTPCFVVRTPDKWPASEVGQVPECSHVFGATDGFADIAVRY